MKLFFPDPKCTPESVMGQGSGAIDRAAPELIMRHGMASSRAGSQRAAALVTPPGTSPAESRKLVQVTRSQPVVIPLGHAQWKSERLSKAGPSIAGPGEFLPATAAQKFPLLKS